MAAVAAVVCALVAGTSVVGHAQFFKPKIDLEPTVDSERVSPGSSVEVSLKVRLPEKVHVQSNKPRDPAFIPTELTIQPPSGVTIEKIVYPLASDLKQEGLDEPLAVYGPEFSITVHLKLARRVAAGTLVVPARLRYQACDEAMCFPPARAETRWTLRVS